MLLRSIDAMWGNVDLLGDQAAGPLALEAAAVRAEVDGFAGFAIPETRHDVFVSLALAARATARIELMSTIAVAFARNPMTVAMAANDVRQVARGRFSLGLGSQVRPHIERRYSMPWSHPAARMEEFLAALRAIWESWQTGRRLVFRGEFYRHTLMTEFFNPGPSEYGPPPLLLAAVGERMTGVAGRMADGVLCHSLTTVDYLRERTLPALRAARGGSLDGFGVCLPVLVAASPAGERAVRRQIAFYASTPAYRAVLDLHGWGGLHERLNRLSRHQAWEEMGELVTDEVFDAFAVSGPPDEVVARVRERFAGLVTRPALYTPHPGDLAQIQA